VAALGYGIGDFLGGSATRRIAAGRTLLWGHLIGLILLLAWIPFDPGEPAAPDLLAGSLASVFGLSGLVFLYNGLARGRAAVVAPSAAVVGAVIPVIAGIGQGDTPNTLGWLGVLAALPAIYLVSTVEGEARSGAGLGYGMAAGAFFGGYFVALAGAGADSGMWPLVASRSLSVLSLAVIGLVASRVWLRPPTGGVGMAVLGVGVLDLVGNIGYLLAANLASLVVVAVVASLYPAVTVLMARVIHLEHLSRRQMVGLSLGVMAVALLSIT
jgi:drug/metabolite transporter (DMT)-like permease